MAKWLKKFKMTEKQLTDLESEINKAGPGGQQDAVRSWLKKNPGLVDKLAPVKNEKKNAGTDPHGSPCARAGPYRSAWPAGPSVAEGSVPFR